MQSSTAIVNYTPAVLRSMCKKQKVRKKEFRLNTLKRVRDELGTILESSLMDDADKAALSDLRDVVRLAIGEE